MQLLEILQSALMLDPIRLALFLVAVALGLVATALYIVIILLRRLPR